MSIILYIKDATCSPASRFAGSSLSRIWYRCRRRVRLMPRPPARVQRRNTKRSESTLLKRSMAACRRFPRTLPSIRSYVYLHVSYKFQIRRNFLFASSFFMHGNYQHHSFSATVLIIMWFTVSAMHYFYILMNIHISLYIEKIFFLWFWKNYYAHQTCIYLIDNTEKKSYGVTANKKNTNIEDKPLMLFVTKNEDTFSHFICMLS